MTESELMKRLYEIRDNTSDETVIEKIQDLIDDRWG